MELEHGDAVRPPMLVKPPQGSDTNTARFAFQRQAWTEVYSSRGCFPSPVSARNIVVRQDQHQRREIKTRFLAMERDNIRMLLLFSR